jgi:enoyl-[acyl-carrier protein] reductase III
MTQSTGTQSTGRTFAGMTAVVTGGGKGIGLGVARALAAAGADIGITYFRDKDAADRAVTELSGLGIRAAAVRGFFGDPHSDAPLRVMAWAEAELGKPDLLVSCAGTGVQRALLDSKRSHWDWAMETHAVTFLRLVQAAPSLRSVVAVSSLGATRVLPGAYGVLGAAKAALESLVRYLAVELAPRCRVNAVTPGLVETQAVRAFQGSERMFDTVRARTPAGRLVLPADVGRLVAFLLSSDAEMVTGQTFVIDGGYSILM